MAKACDIAIPRAELSNGDGIRRVGRLIRRRRLAAHMTQAALAKSLNISYQQVQKYENGTSSPSPERLSKIADLLGVGADYFNTKAEAGAGNADALEDFLQKPEALTLFGAISQLRDREALYQLVLANLAFCEQHAPPAVFGEAVATLFARAPDHSSDARQVAREVRAMKIEMARAIARSIKTSRLTQVFAARFLATDQARISSLSRGRVQGISFERLFRFIVMLGWNTRIEIEDRSPGQRGSIALTERRRGKSPRFAQGERQD